MSPEQALGDPVGTPSDIFSLGTVLAFAATGEGPYGTGSPAARQLRVLNDMPRLDQVPAELRPLVERCMAREPAERPSADQFLAELVAMHPAAANQTDWPPSALLGMAAAQPATPPVEAVAAPAPVTRAPVTRAPADPAAPPEWSPTMTAAPPRPAPSEHAAADKAADPPKPKLSAAAGTPSRRRYRWAAMAAIVAALVGVAGLAVAFPLLARSSQHGQLWAGDVDSKLTAVSDSYWLKVGTAWQDYWVFYPRCTSGACGLDLDGGLYGEPFTAQLLWDGSAYTGSVEIDDYWSCVRAGNYANATLHIQVAGVPAGVPGGVWTITSFTGTLVWSVAYDPNGGCAAETYSWQAQST
jgi:hypothetical protein